MKLVKEVLRAYIDDGAEAGIQILLRHAHPDTQFKPYGAGGRAMLADELLDFYRERRESGGELTLRVTSFAERGNVVEVNGSVRLTRPTGGFAESQVTWTYTFREDGVLDEAHWAPRGG